MAYKYIRYVFAQDGSTDPIPDTTQPSGEVSYQQGFGIRYSKPYPSDPDSLPVPRDIMNQAFQDFSSGLQQYQQRGVPLFISPSMNGGVPYPYAKWSFALFDAGDGLGFQVYQSTVSGNTVAPTDGSGDAVVNTGWSLKDDTVSSNTLDNVLFDASVVQNDVVFYDTAISKYNRAIANGGNPQNYIGFADVARGRIVTFGKYDYLTGLTPGALYYLSTSVYGGITTSAPATNVAPVGIAVSTTRLMIQPNYGNRSITPSSGLPVGTTIDFAAASTPSGFLECDGSAVSRTAYAGLFAVIGTEWGAGDGSTTFNLPLVQRRTVIGAGGTVPVGSTIGNAVGDSGGEEMHVITISQMPQHNHAGATAPYRATDSTAPRTPQASIMQEQSFRSNTLIGVNIPNQGGNQPMCLMQPAVVMRKLIKFQ